MTQLESGGIYLDRSILVMVVPNLASRSAWRDDGDHEAMMKIIPKRECIISSSLQLVGDKSTLACLTDVYIDANL